ncbi:sensor histidine kinase [Nocardioides sp. cx-173]|uniref:sensor histidine kinase n=1 Tax=Nocardioides sp. cx-173 TaxID=2898796 RepID=UPI001E59D3C3|nr:histidine kinase [Nocardioides sp. cx-173]MCD4523816.1 histidine kinase [Nocardioides sp. cx-173]UGB41863.1 histidine kinase [Nocardioides sp. cx-173]
MTGARHDRGRGWPWRSWSALDEVERVDVYTRQSLYLLLWCSLGFVLLGGANEADAAPARLSLVLAGAAVLGVLGTRALTAVADLYPATGPLPWRQLGSLLAACVLAVAGLLALPQDLRLAAGAGIWVVLAWSLGGLRDRVAIASLLVVLTLLPLALTGEWWAAAYGLITGSFFVFTCRVSLWLLGVVTELDAARTAQSALAVAEERLRFSRDVHDVLGRRLSTIAVQAELAATLAGRGDEGAAERMLEVRGIAHEALREARELARGYRATDLAQELEGARALLQSAGIRTEVDVQGLDRAWHEPAGWVVREAVTNVLRHSAATAVSITYADRVLEVRNDGARTTDSGDGSGLAGLRARLAPLGASLEVVRDAPAFAVRLRMPDHELAGAPA